VRRNVGLLDGRSVGGRSRVGGVVDGHVGHAVVEFGGHDCN
jgi:hypothetical protein